MKTGDIARLLGVSDKTIRSWVEHFDDFFSESKTKQRIYTEDDVRVLSTIAKYSHDGFPLASIQEKLESGERVETPSDASYGVDMRLVPAAAVEQMIDATEVRLELEKVKSERDRLTEMVSTMQQEHKDAIQEMRTEITRLHESIVQLQRELGRAEGELNLRRELSKKNDVSNDDNKN